MFLPAGVSIDGEDRLAGVLVDHILLDWVREHSVGALKWVVVVCSHHLRHLRFCNFLPVIFTTRTLPSVLNAFHLVNTSANEGHYPPFLHISQTTPPIYILYLRPYILYPPPRRGSSQYHLKTRKLILSNTDQKPLCFITHQKPYRHH